MSLDEQIEQAETEWQIIVEMARAKKKRLAELKRERDKQPRPCPFCGGEGMPLTDVNEVEQAVYWIQCTECAAEGPGSDTAVGALEVWNRRVD